MSLEELTRKANATGSMENQQVRTGLVVSTDPARATVRVKINDADGMVTNDLFVLCRKSKKDKDYWMPDVGDQGACIFMGNGMEEGFYLGSFFSEPDPVPVSAQDKWHKTFEDGTVLEYDRAEHKLTADVKGEVDVTATKTITATATESITLTAPTIYQNGNVEAGGEKGGEATVTENANRTLNGIFVVNGPISCKSFNCSGDSEVHGNSYSAGRTGAPI